LALTQTKNTCQDKPNSTDCLINACCVDVASRKTNELFFIVVMMTWCGRDPSTVKQSESLAIAKITCGLSNTVTTLIVGVLAFAVVEAEADVVEAVVVVVAVAVVGIK
jgi:hypothetical protein